MTSDSGESSIYFRPSSGTQWAIGKAPWGVGGFGIGILNSGCKLTILDNGNVGINVTNPGYKLHVDGSTYLGKTALDNTAFTDSVQILANNSNESAGESFTTSNSSFGITFVRDWSTGGYRTRQGGIYSVGSSSWRAGLAFRVKDNTTANGTHDITAMWLSPAGRIGIGNVSPSYKLHVTGDAYFSSTVYVAGQPAIQTAAGSGSWNYIRMHNGSNFFDFATLSSSNGGALEVRPAGGSNLGMLWQTNGRTDVCTSNNSTYNYDGSAMWIREYHYGGSQSDTWGNAPRLGWHWGGRVAAQIGLASNGWLYEAPLTATNFYRLVVEGSTGITWNINIEGFARYIEGTNAAANPGGALLRSGSGRPDASPSGDTWIFWDTLGGTSSYWGIRHN